MGKGDRKREELRRQRIEAEQSEKSSGRNRLILGYGLAAVVVIAIAVVVVIVASGGDDEASASGDAHLNLNASVGATNGVQPDDRLGTPPPPPATTDLNQAAKAAGCVLKMNLPDEGNEHIPPGTKAPPYRTNPPTSGPHVEPPFQQADGAYSEMPEPIDMVHSLEHGRVEIQYSPDLPEKDQLALKGLYDTMYGATLLFPNDEMPYAVAATAWTKLIGCKTYEGAKTLDAIRAFGKETWGKYGGEPAEAFTFEGPTPAEPDEG